jgi:uncharacterized protein YueI
MDEGIRSEAISAWGQKDRLEKALMVGMQGVTEFKHDEKVYYLGEFKENVIRLLSKTQVSEAAIYPEIIQALKDKRATKMMMDGSIRLCFIEKYKKLAKKMNKPCIVRSDPEFKGSTGLMVISDDVVDMPVITVEERSVQLKRLGMSSALINSVGKKVCKKCLEQILKVAPQEASNYNELTILDRIGGDRCPVHQVTK